MRFPALFIACSALVAVAFDAAAQSTQLAAATDDQDSREIRAIVEGAARNDASWRKQADDFIRGEQTPSFGNRAHTSDRALAKLPSGRPTPTVEVTPKPPSATPLSPS